jgi:hypothetical protein
MWHMAWGWGGRLRRTVVAGAVTLIGVLAFSVPALGADPPPVPKPDPPPKSKPLPPPPAQPAPQPAPVEPAPVVPAPVAPPAVVHPTAAELRAEAKRRAAAKREAKREAIRAARARAAKARAAAAKKQAAAQRRERERAKDVLAAGDGNPSSPSGLPFLLVAFSLALVLFGLALTPEWAVPWRRGARALEAHREELGVMGVTGVVATVVFFLLIEVTK